MLTLKLRAFDRLLLVGMLDRATRQGESLSQLSKLLKLHDKINFTDEERTLLNVRVEEGQIRWNRLKDGLPEGEEVDTERDVEISDEQKELLVSVFKKNDENKMFTSEGLKETLKIAEQIGYQVQS